MNNTILSRPPRLPTYCLYNRLTHPPVNCHFPPIAHLWIEHNYLVNRSLQH